MRQHAKWIWGLGLLLVLALAVAVWKWPRVQPPSQPGLPTPLGGSPEPAPGSEPQRAVHPLEPALEIARAGLEQIDGNIRDYTAVIHKRERVGGSLVENRMEAKIRHGREGDSPAPFAVYLKFQEPASVAGREVIWVEGQNDGKLIAHEAGFANLIRAKLVPTGFLAMLGNRYPITAIGIRNLVSRLIEKGEQGLKRPDVQVTITAGENVDGRECTLIEVRNPEQREGLDFHIAQIYIDKEWNVPLRYQAFDWPETEGEQPALIEQYTYEGLKLNVGLRDEDFDPDNPAYKFP